MAGFSNGPKLRAEYIALAGIFIGAAGWARLSSFEPSASSTPEARTLGTTVTSAQVNELQKASWSEPLAFVSGETPAERFTRELSTICSSGLREEIKSSSIRPHQVYLAWNSKNDKIDSVSFWEVAKCPNGVGIIFAMERESGALASRQMSLLRSPIARWVVLPKATNDVICNDLWEYTLEGAWLLANSIATSNGHDNH